VADCLQADLNGQLKKTRKSIEARRLWQEVVESLPRDPLRKKGLSSSFKEREIDAESMLELMLRVLPLRKFADSLLKFLGSPSRSGESEVHSATTAHMSRRDV
jgi:hypothetical protein